MSIILTILCSEKFLGPRLLFSSVGAGLMAITQINWNILMMLYFEIYRDPFGVFAKYTYANKSEELKWSEADDYLDIPHVQAVLSYFVWFIVDILWFIFTAPLIVCGFSTLKLGKGAAIYVLLPWIILTVIILAIDIPMWVSFHNYAGENKLYANSSYMWMDTPMTTAENDNTTFLFKETNNFINNYYINIHLPFILIFLLNNSHICFLLWRRPDPAKYAAFIKLTKDMPDSYFNRGSLHEGNVDERGKSSELIDSQIYNPYFGTSVSNSSQEDFAAPGIASSSFDLHAGMVSKIHKSSLRSARKSGTPYSSIKFKDYVETYSQRKK